MLNLLAWKSSVCQIFDSKMKSDENSFSGYRLVNEIPAQHIRLFAPWIFDENLQILEIFKDVLGN